MTADDRKKRRTAEAAAVEPVASPRRPNPALLAAGIGLYLLCLAALACIALFG